MPAARVHFGAIRTVGGYPADEVSSALQKSIRRGLVDDAMYWASELDMSGYGNYVFKRLRTIATEDIGPADSTMAVVVDTLHRQWLECRKPRPNVGENMFLVHAVIACAMAPKSRIVDHALTVHYTGAREHREVPDWALDKHTERGREMGRGFDHFFAEGALLLPAPALPDPYAERAREILTAPKRRRARPPIQPPSRGGSRGSQRLLQAHQAEQLALDPPCNTDGGEGGR